MQSTTSTDGTTIAFDQTGQGPTLILITGALNYSKFGVVGDLVPLLSNSFTVINYDRRGRGASGDNLPYSIYKEIEDINALIDAAGSPASLYGHSAGGALALFAAAELGQSVKAVAAYEPPLSDNWRSDVATILGIRQFKQLLSKGQKLELITKFMDFIGMSSDLIEETLSSEHRDVLIEMAPTLVYEAKIKIRMGRFLKYQARRIQQPALFISGDKTYPDIPKIHGFFRRAVPDGQVMVLPGQTHTVEAKFLAPILEGFFKTQ